MRACHLFRGGESAGDHDFNLDAAAVGRGERLYPEGDRRCAREERRGDGEGEVCQWAGEGVRDLGVGHVLEGCPRENVRISRRKQPSGPQACALAGCPPPNSDGDASIRSHSIRRHARTQLRDHTESASRKTVSHGMTSKAARGARGSRQMQERRRVRECLIRPQATVRADRGCP